MVFWDYNEPPESGNQFVFGVVYVFPFAVEPMRPAFRIVVTEGLDIRDVVLASWLDH